MARHSVGLAATRRLFVKGGAGMVFVRNATGVSHSPDEHVELDDAAVAARALGTALESLASRRTSSRAPHGSIR